jgi:hypothetical protein
MRSLTREEEEMRAYFWSIIIFVHHIFTNSIWQYDDDDNDWGNGSHLSQEKKRHIFILLLFQNR